MVIASIQEVLEVNLSYGKTGYKNVQLFRNIATKRVEKWRYALYNPRLNLFRTKSGSCKRQITCEWHFNKRLFTFAARKINIGKFQHKKTNVMVVTDVAVSKRVKEYYLVGKTSRNCLKSNLHSREFLRPAKWNSFPWFHMHVVP